MQSKAIVYDLAKVVSGGDPSTWLVGEVPNPTPFKQIGGGGYHDFYVGYDPATHQDKFYGAGLGGYSVWDVTHPEAPKQLFTITSLGMDIAHTFTPSPDGRYAVTETEYQYTPLRIWDLEPGQTGKTQNIDHADQRVDGRLARPLAQPRSALAVRVRVGVRGWPAGLQSQGSEEPEDGRPLVHLRVRARARLRRHAGQRLAEHDQRGAGCVRRRRTQLRRA